MSVYNGHKYLKEQIDSILNQVDVDVELYIRDDGSSDQSFEIIEEYCSLYNNIHLDSGENIGFRQSFITELKNSGDCNYYAFSDQDDYWEKDKLISACKMIEKIMDDKDLPVVYYSNLSVSDENLNIYRTTDLEKRKNSLESIIMRRSIAGCTMVFNKAMLRYVNMAETTDDMLKRGHDSFILTLCYAVGGKVVCDEQAHIRYRQHNNNTSGSSNGIKQRIKKEWNALVNKKGSEPAIAKSILQNWVSSIDDEMRNTLELVVDSEKHFRSRLRIFFSGKFTTGNIKLTMLGKFRALLGML